MIQTIIFSKNRAAQLDLLLRSLEARAPNIFYPIEVIYTVSAPEYRRAYKVLDEEHPNVFIAPECEKDFQGDVEACLSSKSSNYVSFFCDDDIMVRPFTDQPSPEKILRLDNRVLCVSLRLGTNTTNCYPLNREQTAPVTQYAVNDALYWEWIGADADWGYPGSLDGHVFRRNTLLTLLEGQSFQNPNQLEETLQKRCYTLKQYELMSCYRNSVITGVPVNRVNQTHPNRFGETNPMNVEELNLSFLAGKRLNLGEINRKQVVAAHNELKLSFV